MLLQYIDVLIGLSVILGGVSLVVTLLVQMWVAFFALRGTNLRWGLEMLFESVDAGSLRDHGREISEAVLHHPLISDSTLSTKFAKWGKLERGGRKWLGDHLRKLPFIRRLTLAKVVREDELLPVLRDLVEHGAGQPWHDALVAAFGRGAPGVSKLVDDASGGVLPPSTVNAIANRLSAAYGVGQTIRHQLKARFDGTMDRVSQRFATHSRLITILLAFPVALFVQLDVLEIFTRLSTDPELRTALVQEAEVLAKRDFAVEERTRVQAALESAAKAHPALAKADLSSVKTAAQARTRIPGALDEGADADAALQSFNRDYFALSQKALGAQFDRLNASLGKLNLLALGGLDAWRERWPDQARESLRHLFGILFGGALLSLGAPFWFNLLKTLMNLRPSLAQKEEQERLAPSR